MEPQKTKMLPKPKEVPRKASFKVVIKRVSRPMSDDFNREFEWLCSSLGFLEPIDKDKVAANVFKEVLVATERGEALTSTAISHRVGMSRGSVINHLNNLLRAGLIERHGRYYTARGRTVQATVQELEEDIEQIFSRMKKVAKSIDEELGLD
jgi:predicted transcriptional regulator